MSGQKLHNSKLTLYESMTARLSNDTGLHIPVEKRSQQKFIEEQVLMTKHKQFGENQRQAALYLHSRIKDVNDPYLKLEVYKINEIVSRKY